jgi:hypothetical protein
MMQLDSASAGLGHSTTENLGNLTLRTTKMLIEIHASAPAGCYSGLLSGGRWGS